MPGQRIRTDDGYLTGLGFELGQERLGRFISGQANVQAMSLFLVMAVSWAPHAGYSDEALDVLISDAEDVRKAANEWADSCVELAEAWRRQRESTVVREVGDRARHRDSGWAGDVIAVDGTQVTVRPDHPRPNEVLTAGGDFVPTPDDWPGWRPITVEVDELEKVPVERVGAETS